jgi:hypothetical protein
VATATGKSSAATPGKVVATVKAANASLRTAKPAANRSTSEAAAAHASAAEAATPHAAAVEAAASSAVHPTAATTVTATTTATASHCWRSKSESESESCRSNQFEISHRILSFSGETEFSPSAGEVPATFIVPKIVSHYRAHALALHPGNASAYIALGCLEKVRQQPCSEFDGFRQVEPRRAGLGVAYARPRCDLRAQKLLATAGVNVRTIQRGHAS